MAVDLGLVGIRDRGDYSASATYSKGDFVLYDGSSYLCLLDNTSGIIPSNNGTTWKYLARGGEAMTMLTIPISVNGPSQSGDSAFPYYYIYPWAASTVDHFIDMYIMSGSYGGSWKVTSGSGNIRFDFTEALTEDIVAKVYLMRAVSP